MKKTIILVFCFLVFNFLNALGTLRVESIKMLPETNMNIEVRDADGKYAPVLIVKSDLKGLGFQNVSRPTLHSAEYIAGDHHYKFYLNDNQRVVKITHSDYEPLEIRLLADFGINVKTQRIYEMILTNIPEKNYIPINIVTEPSGAQIYIDDVNKGIDETHKVFIGKHTIRIIKKGYKSIVTEIEVTESKTLFKYTLTEIEDVPIMIYSEPEGATVYFDNVRIGETPLASFYPDGKYKIKIEKKLYEIIDEQIVIKLPKIEKRYNLEPLYAIINIKTYPNATVYLNEIKLDSLHNLHLEPMLINLKVIMPKAKPLEKRIILKKNETMTIDLFPNVKTGTIQVGIIPEDSKIELLGDGGEYYTANEISNFKDIPIGKYELKVTRDEYKPYFETLLLKEEQKIKKQITLETVSKDTTMVFVKGGHFIMPMDNSRKKTESGNKAFIDDFYISKYEVTVGEWKEFINESSYITNGDLTFSPEFKTTWDTLKFETDNHPVTCINWYDAIMFCNWKSVTNNLTPYYIIDKNVTDKRFNQIYKISEKNGVEEKSKGGKIEDRLSWEISIDSLSIGYRLPTEIEWVYAALGGDKSKGYTYSGSNYIDEVAWTINNSDKKSHPIGTKKPNELNLYDMSGNVSEWCWNYYSENEKNHSKNHSKNPENVNDIIHRPIKGSNYYFNLSDFNIIHNEYWDFLGTPASAYPWVGFRICKSIHFDDDYEESYTSKYILERYFTYIVVAFSVIIAFFAFHTILKNRSRKLEGES